MSYTRKYRQTARDTISVPYPYFDGKNHSTRHQNVSIAVPIEIDITVDTDPFDESITDCNEHVSVLTGSVIASEAAQITSIRKNAKSISGTIVEGFFGLIRSELSQQISEMKPRVEALLIELIKHQESCIGKKSQMEQDYLRISKRYLKLFDELDKEMYNRIRKMDEAAFTIHGKLNDQVSMSISDVNAGIVTIFNKEGGSVHSMLFASGLRSKAMQLLNNGKKYLISEKNLARNIKRILSSESTEKYKRKNIPIVMLEAKSSAANTDKEIKYDNNFSSFQKTDIKPQILKSFENTKWKALDEVKRKKMEDYFQLEINKTSAVTSEHTSRVSEKIMQLWNTNKNIQCTN